MQKRFVLCVLSAITFCWMPLTVDSRTTQNYTVINTHDAGPGSLRAGLYDPAPTILFDIPRTDPGYDPVNRIWVIKAASSYNVPAGKVIDGRVAREGGGVRPGIEMDGALLGLVGATGFNLNEGVVVRGLIVHSCGYGIWIAQSNVTISECYIGTDASGTVAKPNGVDGVLFIHGAQNGMVERNLISGNGSSGIRISGSATACITVLNNRVGTDFTATAAIPNANFGVALFNGPCNNVIGGENVIAFNGKAGVLVDGANSMTSTIGNTITRNSIYANGAEGIKNYRGGNAELAPPLLTAVSATQVSGTTVAGQIVELFADENGQGKVFLGSTLADFSGHFTLVLTASPALPQITATVVDDMSNTSAFSTPMTTEIKPGASTSDLPRQYRLSQNYPNPFNPGTTLHYELPRAGDVWLAIYDRSGRQVRRLVDGQQQPGVHRIPWNGTDDNGVPVAAGLYFGYIRAGTLQQRIKLTLVQ